MVPEIVESIYGLKKAYLENAALTAGRINSRNASIYWESERNVDFIHSFLKRRHDVEGDRDRELLKWFKQFDQDKYEAAYDFWFEISKGVHESLREF